MSGKEKAKQSRGRSQSRGPAKSPGPRTVKKSETKVLVVDAKLKKNAKKKQQRKQPQKKADRDIADVEEPALNRELEVLAGQSLIQDISTKLADPCGTSGNNLWATAIGFICSKIQSLDPEFFTNASASGGSASRLSPADVAMALRHVIWCYFTETGVLPAQTTTLVPKLPRDAQVPVSLAYLLHHFAPYDKKGLKASCTTSSTIPLSAGSWGIGTAGTGICYSPQNVWVPTNTYSKGAEPILGLNTVSPPAFSFAPTMATLIAIAKVINCVDYGKIWKRAVDFSAYAMTSNESNHLCAPTEDFSPELAGIFTWDNTGSSGIFTCGKAPPYSNTNRHGSLVSAATITAWANFNPWLSSIIEHGCHMKYVPVPITRAYTLKGVHALDVTGTRIRKLAINVSQMNMDLFKTYCGKLASQYLGGSATSLGLSGQDFANFYICMASALIAKLGQYMWLATHNPVWSKIFRSIEAPLTVVNAVHSLGPVIEGGELRISLPYTFPGDWLASSTTPYFYSISTAPLAASNSLFKNVAFAANVGTTTLNTAGFLSTPAVAGSTQIEGVTNFPGAKTTTTGVYPLTPFWNAPGYASFLRTVFASSYNPVSSGNQTGAPGTGAPMVPVFPIDVMEELGGITQLAYVQSQVIGQPIGATAGTSPQQWQPYDTTIARMTCTRPLTRPELGRIFLLGLCPQLLSTDSMIGAFSAVVAEAGVDGPGAAASYDASDAVKNTAALAIANRERQYALYGGQVVDTTKSNPLMLALAPLALSAGMSLVPTAVNFVNGLVDRIMPGKDKAGFAPLASAPDLNAGAQYLRENNRPPPNRYGLNFPYDPYNPPRDAKEFASNALNHVGETVGRGLDPRIMEAYRIVQQARSAGLFNAALPQQQ